jgi:hypothetical protein
MRAGAPVGTFSGNSYQCSNLNRSSKVSGFSGALAFSLRAYGLCRSRNANPDMVRVAFSQSNNVLGASVLQFGLGALRHGDGGDDAADFRGMGFPPRLSRVQSTSS